MDARAEAGPALGLGTDDAEELVDELRRRFGAPPAVLVGHSWGTLLGTLLVQRRPEAFRAYVGVGQVVDTEAEWPIQERFIEEEALRRGDAEALDDIRRLGRGAAEKWLFRYGGELAAETSWLPLLLTGLRAPEYSLFEVMRVGRASAFSSRHMTQDVFDGALGEHVRSYPVPAFFFTGRRDYTTPWPLVQAFFERVDAPLKRLVWFERCAHFPFFEEPEKFAREMRAVLEQTAVPTERSATSSSSRP